MNTPKHLLLLIDELDIGGTEQQIFELVKRLDRHKYAPMVCCFRPGRVSREIEALGVPVFTLRKRSKFDPTLILSLIWLIQRANRLTWSRHICSPQTPGHAWPRF